MRQFPPWGLVGAGIFTAGLAALVFDLPHWNTFWYVPAWWGYLLILDAVVHGLEGRSWVGDRRRELLFMLFWSVPFWFLFEAFNLRLQNWYYVFVPHDDRIQEVVAWLSFATVLPACCFHARLARSLGWFEETRWRPLPVGRRLVALLLFLGVVSVVAPLLWPRYAFPLIWGATLWLPALDNYRGEGPSLLRELERGDPRRFLRLLAGGLLAGLAWESLNYWARTKWVYTVPGFEDWKLFEMPLAGFLGFPVLAVGAFSFYAMVRRYLLGRRWKLLLAGFLAVAFSHLVFLSGIESTVRARRPLLREIPGLSLPEIETLAKLDMGTPERLVGRVEEEGLGAVAGAARLDQKELRRAHAVSRLALHKGMGVPAALSLHRIGIEDPSDLAGADPRALWSRLRRSPGPAPTLDEVEVWVRAASLTDGPRR